ncbi:MAG: hypothetical protein NTY65_05530, partial [Planctomycetota bacterium]|nr:hypothetical protein [Planctomycetota bacterium]
PPPPPVEGAPGTPGAPAAPTGPQAGVVVRIVGITPKDGPTATQYLNSGLIETLRKDPRTVRLKNAAGEEEVLAKIVRLLPFRGGERVPGIHRQAGRGAGGRGGRCRRG